MHVDPLSSTPSAVTETRRKSRTKSKIGDSDIQATSHITEVYASTRAYPSWWSDLEESRVLRRRKSMGDSVLERNLCFVDTPGYGNKTSVSIELKHPYRFSNSQVVSGVYHTRCRLC